VYFSSTSVCHVSGGFLLNGVSGAQADTSLWLCHLYSFKVTLETYLSRDKWKGKWGWEKHSRYLSQVNNIQQVMYIYIFLYMNL
jgi:hypothetical protein